MPESADHVRRHFTTRQPFTIFVGLLVLALYFVWAFYGAAPTSLRFLTEAQAERTPGASPGGHGSSAGGMKPEAFEEIAYRFVEDFGLPDGSVRPMRQPMGSMAAAVGSDGEGEADEHRESATEDDRHGSATKPDKASQEGSSVAQAESFTAAKKRAPATCRSTFI